jgi:CHAD domain-containing protein
MASKRSDVAQGSNHRGVGAGDADATATEAGLATKDAARIARRREFRLHADEALTVAVRRIAVGQVEDSLERLEHAHNGDRAEAVHDARKSLKRLRALLRLVRDDLRDARYRSENAHLRDIARALAAARDADVLLELLVRVRTEDGLGGAALDSLQASLQDDVQRSRVALEQESVADVTGQLHAARERMRRWPLPERGFDTIAGGLERVYRQGRRGRKRARRERTPEALHEWRKSVKYLRHAAEVLEPVRPRMLRRVARDARALGDMLGDDHDLSVLGDTALSSAMDEDAVAPLIAAIDARRAHLQRDALALGKRLYKRSPTSFTARVRAGWRKRSDGVALRA